MSSAEHCIFCFKHREDVAVCSYGLGHEFPATETPVQPKRIDKMLCTKCGLHPKNPAAGTNGCPHEFPYR